MAALRALGTGPMAFAPGTKVQAAMLCAKTQAKKKFPMTMNTMPLIRTLGSGFLFMSKPISRPQILPKRGVYHRNPRKKLTMTATKMANMLIFNSKIFSFDGGKYPEGKVNYWPY